MVALLLVATFLRLVAWLDAPPGMRYDEVTVVYEAEEIRAGARPIYMDGSAEEALFHYAFALAQDIVAPHLFTLRWLSAAFGLIAVAATYALGRGMFGTPVGLMAAALATASFWSLMYSRVGLRIIALPAFVLLGMIFLWRGLRRLRRTDFVIAGIFFGISAYTYSATRMLPLIFIGFGLYLAIVNRARFRQHAGHVAVLLLISVIIALPMAIHIVTVPAAERRLGEVEGPLQALQGGDVKPLIGSALTTASMFVADGDPEWLYNIPHRPVFDIITGLIFYLGIVICLRKLRQESYAFLSIWLIGGLLPPMLTWPAASSSHSMLAQAPTFLIAAIGLQAVATHLGQLRTSRAPLLAALSIGIVLTLNTIHSADDYFDRWANDPNVRNEYAANLTATARHLQRHPPNATLVFSSGNVTHWNPWSETAFRMIAPIGYRNARWFDARSSFVFPRGHTDLVLINIAYDGAPAPLDARLIEDLFPIVEPSPLSTSDFTATHLVSSLNARLITLAQAAVACPPDAPSNSPCRLPIVFDDQVALIGYEVRKPIVQPGKNIRLTTYWRAQNIGPEPLSIFVHVLNAQGNIAAQWDGYSFAPHYLESGDIIVQVHFIPIPPDFAEGTYQLELGLYLPRVPHQPRVPIAFMGQPVTERILLQPIEVKYEKPTTDGISSAFINQHMTTGGH